MRLDEAISGGSDNDGDDDGDDCKYGDAMDIQPMPATLDTFFPNQWLDVQDTFQNWLEGQVVAVDEKSGSSVRVHYKGWKAKWDEWIPMDDPRLAPLHTHTSRPSSHAVPTFRQGMMIDAQDPGGLWLTASVIDLDPAHGQVKVHYVDWSSIYDEWLNADSYRLAPFHTFAHRPEEIKLAAHSRLPLDSSSHRVGVSGLSPQSASSLSVDDYKRQGDFQPSSNQEAHFRHGLLAAFGFRILDMASDGNCLFRSVAHQVYGDAGCHAVVRAKTIKYIAAHKDFFASFIDGSVDDYIAAKAMDGTWGDHVEIQAMSELYERGVHIYAHSTTPIVFGARDPSKPIIYLSYHCMSHYNSIITPQPAPIIQTTPGVFEEIQIARLSSVVRPDSVEAGVTERTLLASRQDYDRRLIDDQQIKAALGHSLESFEADQKSKAVQESLAMEQESELQAALAASLKEEEDKLQEVLVATLRETEEEKANEMPAPIRHCFQVLKYPLERCVEAYSVCKDASPSPDMVTVMMMNYLSSSSSSPS